LASTTPLSVNIKKLIAKGHFRIVLGVLSALAVLWVSYAQVFERYELQTYDWRFSLRGPRPVSQDIVLIDIWDDTLAALGRWPFDRQYHAALIQALSAAGAKAVVFDVVFVEPSPQDDMVALAARAAKNVYFAFGFSSPHIFPGRFVATKIESPLLPAFAAAAKGSGFINIQVDLDGKRRRVMPVIHFSDKDYYHLSFRVLMDALGVRQDEMVFSPGRYLEFGKKLRVPLDADGCFMINYAGRWKDTFRHYSYVDVLSAYAQKLSGEKSGFDLEKLRGKICVIGLTAQGTHDTNPNPIEAVYPGVGTYANVINTVLQRDFILRLSRFANLLALLLVTLCTAWVSFYKRPFTSFLYTFATLTIFIAVGVNLFIYAGVWMDLFFPVLVCVVVYMTGTLTRIISEMRKRELIESELKIASQIQKSFLPVGPPEHKGLKVATFFQPAKAVGGDLYSFIQAGPEKVGVMVGDVSGKGTPAALFMAKTAAEFKFSAHNRPDPAEVVAKLNDSIASESTGGLFVTLTYAIFDLAAKKLTLANAGHLPVVVSRPGGKAELLSADGGMPIGVMADMPYSNIEVPLASGECYAFYSDGISEARNKKKDEFGVEALQKSLETYHKLEIQQVLEKTVEDVTRFMGKADQHDDMTLIVVQIL